MSEAQPEWAPDGCPPAVVKLIEDEEYLHALGMRLASADSAELHQAVRKLQRLLGEAFASGKIVGRSRGGGGPFLVGLLIGALSAIALASLTGLV